MNVTITRGKRNQSEQVVESSESPVEPPSAVAILLGRFNNGNTSLFKQLKKIDRYDREASENLSNAKASNDQPAIDFLLQQRYRLAKEANKLLNERLMESLAVIENLLIEFRLEGKPVD